MQRPPDQAVGLLSLTVAYPVLREFIRELYRDWMVRTAKEYLHLSTGAREDAFAVAVERLARDARRGKLDAGTFGLRAHAEALSALQRHRERNARPGYVAQCLLWQPATVDGVAVSPADLVELVWRAALGERSPTVDAALGAFAETWRRRAARTFRNLDAEGRQDAIDRALMRLISPVTAACLTPDNLSRRCRSVACQALTDANDKQEHARVFEDIENIIHRLAADDPAEDQIARSFGERVREELVGTLERFFPWMRSVLRNEKTLAQVAREQGRTHDALRQLSSRVHRFLHGVAALLQRLGYSKRTPEEAEPGIEGLRREIRVPREFVRQVAAAIKRVAESDLARSILPAPVLNSLLRIAARLHNPWGRDGEDSGPT